MNTSKKIIFALTLCFTAIPSLALASVVFEQTPLFSNTNFAPGEIVSRHFTVTNDTTTIKTVAIEVINGMCGTPCLSNKLHVKILGDGTKYFDDTLAKFFSAGETAIGTLPANTPREYTMSVSFVPDAVNEYQAKTATFDLLVGFRGEEGQSDNNNNNNGNGGGGGGSVLPRGLQIQNEATVTEADNSITVSWTTNYSAYGHVIYGIDTGVPYVLDLSQPNFGYPHSTPSDPSIVEHTDTEKSSNHSFTLSGLASGTYRYRIVSHASPPTVSYEHTFIVPKKVALTENETPAEEAILLQNQGETGIVEGTSGSIIKNDTKLSEKNITANTESEISKNKNTNSNSFVSSLASAGLSLQKISLRGMLGIGILALILGYFTAKKMKK